MPSSTTLRIHATAAHCQAGCGIAGLHLAARHQSEAVSAFCARGTLALRLEYRSFGQSVSATWRNQSVDFVERRGIHKRRPQTSTACDHAENALQRIKSWRRHGRHDGQTERRAERAKPRNRKPRQRKGEGQGDGSWAGRWKHRCAVSVRNICGFRQACSQPAPTPLYGFHKPRHALLLGLQLARHVDADSGWRRPGRFRQKKIVVTAPTPTCCVPCSRPGLACRC